MIAGSVSGIVLVGTKFVSCEDNLILSDSLFLNFVWSLRGYAELKLEIAL